MLKALTTKSVWIAVLITALYTMLSFQVYLARGLDNNVDNHILSSAAFGVPAALADKGLRPFFQDNREQGWDGQFYYYIANDILARRDTARHIDSPSYRYQRVGLSLYAAIAATVTGQDWVSPKGFLASYFALVLAATLLGGCFLLSLGISAYVILFWSLNVGTQLTLFNALPDAAADAFLIIGLCALAYRQTAAATAAFVFAVLSREIYIVFPLAIALAYAIGDARKVWPEQAGWPQRLQAVALRRSVLIGAVPLLAEAGWQGFLRLKFGVSSVAQSGGILGAPLAAWLDYLRLAARGAHPHALNAPERYFEAAALLIFAAVTASAFGLAAAGLYRSRHSATPILQGVMLATLALSATYLCFGPIVMMLYTGYIKAATILFLLIPIIVVAPGLADSPTRALYGALALGVGVLTAYQWWARIVPVRTDFDQITRASTVVSGDAETACIAPFVTSVQIKGIALLGRKTLFDTSRRIVVEVDLTNQTKVAFASHRKRGAFFLSYQWLNPAGNVVVDGIRSAFDPPLQPGETARMSIVAELPSRAEELVISAVQEACSWSYQSPATATPRLSLKRDEESR